MKVGEPQTAVGQPVEIGRVDRPSKAIQVSDPRVIHQNHDDVWGAGGRKRRLRPPRFGLFYRAANRPLECLCPVRHATRVNEPPACTNDCWVGPRRVVISRTRRQQNSASAELGVIVAIVVIAGVDVRGGEAKVAKHGDVAGIIVKGELNDSAGLL